ncbi:helicase HerA-like domain-containing protein [Legionella sp. W05-934-2]|jgi:DNA helicase HerA-like ATPase|uniref:helicase HerA-like domain-containing protein n=1 Tax=Legionella sp. W05-934-2 TaxID=1198649 RepID=UPI0034618914
MNEALKKAYARPDLPAIRLGNIMINDVIVADAPAYLVLKSLNRHGLIAGATGSGKTKTVQGLCEQLSLQGVPVLAMDMKGDLSGLTKPGQSQEALIARSQSLQLDFEPRAFSCELLTIDAQEIGIPVRATIESFGSLLFSRLLETNDAQSGVLTILFQYAEDNDWPLIEIDDLKAMIRWAQSDEGKTILQQQYGHVSRESLGAIMRKLIELESQGAHDFFGEPAFDFHDLMRVNEQGQGILSILRLMNLQSQPQLFSTFMLKLLNDLFLNMPECGDLDKPKCVIIVDEAHLLFKQANKALLDMTETVVKLIRSKGVGILFCTQTPNDIPEQILGQLGLKIQHSLRAFTAKDRKAIKLVAQNFPISEDYDTEQLLTSLGIGEALISALNAKGQPTPLIQCCIRPPLSRMGALTDNEASQLVVASSLNARYGKRIDQRSAEDILAGIPHPKPGDKAPQPSSKAEKSQPSWVEKASKNTLVRQVVRQFFRDLFRTILSIMGVKGRRK